MNSQTNKNGVLSVTAKPAARSGARLVVSLLTSLAVLNGCGGGGGAADIAQTITGTNPTPNNATALSNTSTAPITTLTSNVANEVFKEFEPGIAGCTLPTSSLKFSEENGFSFDQVAQESEFANLLSHLRCLVSLPQLNRIVSLDDASAKHADYSLANGTVTHTQDVAKPSFSGANPGERMGLAGYQSAAVSGQPAAWGEIIAKTGSSAKESFDGLTAAIYHRFVMLSPQFSDVGVSLKQAKNSTDMVSVADFASTQSIISDRLIAYPANLQVNVPISFNSDYETPDPFPGVGFIGYPVSIQSDRGTQLKVVKFEIRKEGSSQALSAYVRGDGAQADANMESHTAFLATQANLEHGTTYNVVFEGQVTKAGVVTTMQQAWSFTTAPKLELATAQNTKVALGKFTRVKLNGCGSTYTWQYTNGLEVGVFTNQWMQVKAVRAGAQWVEVTDACGQKQRINFEAV